MTFIRVIVWQVFYPSLLGFILFCYIFTFFCTPVVMAIP